MRNLPIPPLRDVSGWKEVRITPTNESLVSLKKLNHPKIVVSPEYYKQGVTGAVDDCYVRERIRDMLIEATNLLPEGCKFVVWDTWRPLAVQEFYYLHYKEIFRKEFPTFSEAELSEYTQKFFSLPSDDPTKPSPHNTGGSVDLSIVDKNSVPMNMGTEFDEMTEKAYTRYFEKKLSQGDSLTEKEKEALENRRLLYHIMTNVGFTSYSEEWWHFDFGNQFYAKIKGTVAFYGKISP